MVSKVFRLFAVHAIVLIAVAANGWAQEAPQSFEFPNTLLSQKQFLQARAAFDRVMTPATGLGIHFNETSCAGCHVAAAARGLPGGSGPITELRAGFLGRSKEFIPAPGGTLITTRAVGNATPEIKALSNRQSTRARFITPSLFGAGFVECVADDMLRRIARDQADDSHGRIRGLAREVAILEAPGATAVGRFGWAAQHASLLSFSADAFRNEIGITSPLALNDNTLLGDPVDDGVADPEDTGGRFGVDVELAANFMRALPAPPRLLPRDSKERKEVDEGFKVFKSTGCATCHLPELVTASSGTWVNGRSFRVPKALGNKKFHPYGDFLLHDIGTGPAILREDMPIESRGTIRTAALWGIGTRLVHGEPLLHDGSAQSLEDAIQRHANSAAREAEKFQRLREKDRSRLLKFLRSL